MRVSRRSVLAGSAAVSGSALLASVGLAMPGAGVEYKSSLPPLRPDNLTTPNLPDFSHIEQSQCVDHYRPHRRCGIRLELKKYEAPGGGKFVIHNYGHSGAGVTLSWGCAGEVVKRAREAKKQLPAKTPLTIAVLGAGVVGLTSAYELRLAFPNAKMTIYEKSFDDKNRLDLTQGCSWIAGGQIEPSVIWQEYLEKPGEACQVKKELQSLMKNAMERIRQFAATPDRAQMGIEPRKNYCGYTMKTGFERVVPEPNFWQRRTGILPFDNTTRPGREVSGCEYQTWLMNPRFLMPFLLQWLQSNHVKVERKNFHARSEVMALPQSLIVNCTGLGAAKLFDDKTMEAIKGKLIILPNPQKIDYFFSGGCHGAAYLFGRQNDIVIGGTYEQSTFSENPPPLTGDCLHQPENCGRCDCRAVPTIPVPRGAPKSECKEFFDRIQMFFRGDASQCGFQLVS